MTIGTLRLWCFLREKVLYGVRSVGIGRRHLEVAVFSCSGGRKKESGARDDNLLTICCSKQSSTMNVERHRS